MWHEVQSGRQAVHVAASTGSVAKNRACEVTGSRIDGAWAHW